MELLTVILVIIGALIVIASGIWVAIGLVNVISRHRAAFESESHLEQSKTEDSR